MRKFVSALYVSIMTLLVVATPVFADVALPEERQSQGPDAFAYTLPIVVIVVAVAAVLAARFIMGSRRK